MVMAVFPVPEGGNMFKCWRGRERVRAGKNRYLYKDREKTDENREKRQSEHIVRHETKTCKSLTSEQG